MTIEARPSSLADWHAARATSIGASEVAALIGVSPWSTPYELWAAKSGLLPPAGETPAMRRGNILEAVALEILADERPAWKITPNPMPGGRHFRDEAAGLSATPDAFVVDPDRAGLGVCQVKSVEPSAFRAKWREDGEVAVPLYVAAQAIMDAVLSGSQWACVAALVVGQGIDLHVLDVPLHAGVIRLIRERAADFWDRVARNDPPPPDYGRDGAAIAAIWDEADGAEIDMTADARMGELADLRATLKLREADGEAAAKLRKTVDAEIIHRLANAPSARIAGGRVISAKTVRRAAYQAKASVFRCVKIKEHRA